MSIQELHTRIAKLEAEIVLQRELLKNLERDKGLIQRQLNAALDPMERLPLEISSDIFLRSLDAFPESGAHHNRPPSISLFGGFKVDDDDVWSIIWEHGQQLKHLEIFKAVDEDEVEGDVEDEDGCIGGPWGNTSPGPGRYSQYYPDIYVKKSHSTNVQGDRFSSFGASLAQTSRRAGHAFGIGEGAGGLKMWLRARWTVAFARAAILYPPSHSVPPYRAAIYLPAQRDLSIFPVLSDKSTKILGMSQSPEAKYENWLSYFWVTVYENGGSGTRPD
ncbi:hypothetical protein DFH08DRAFT_1036766 [Mycena albidolilacea]|uniref:Uncharacterized protein n=1 Tax=Mycena albidolilacea TaxID=1033008 RepID=A0AAD7EE97_9AGAR|nr:hypothetical protein DFH08DRAFT_1036766 [Mycena albidolilacea]